MKFSPIDPPKSVRTDYISEDGKIQLIRDDSACITTKYMAAFHAEDGIVIIVKCGATPKAAISRLREAALQLSSELNKVAADCAEDITISGEDTNDEVD